jgi:hypothetical protein
MPDRIPTFADVCSAIAEGRLSVETDGSVYQINAFELRRYFNNCRSVLTPSLAFSSMPADVCEGVQQEMCAGL